MLCGAAVPVITQTPATAGTIQTLKERAFQLANEINASYTRLNILDEAYNQAQTRISELQASVRTENKAILTSEQRLANDNGHLRAVAIDAYVNGDSSGLAVFLDGNQQQLPMQQAYLSAASSNLDEAVSNVEIDRHSLNVRKAALLKSESAEVATRAQVSKDIAQAKSVTASLETTLASVKGQLAVAVAAQERLLQAQAAAAAQRAAAAAKAAEPPPPPPPPPVQTGGGGGGGVTTGGGSGATAVRAAESQLGVPYVWGGATPGVGFDCSGLTMWSWSQAGVSLAHGATDQYFEIAHVSMSNLQPGDLIFYGDAGYLYHVVMYVGSGPYGADTVIQAEETGTDIMYTPIPPGAYGAGQP